MIKALGPRWIHDWYIAILKGKVGVLGASLYFYKNIVQDFIREVPIDEQHKMFSVLGLFMRYYKLSKLPKQVTEMLKQPEGAEIQAAMLRCIEKDVHLDKNYRYYKYHVKRVFITSLELDIGLVARMFRNFQRSDNVFIYTGSHHGLFVEHFFKELAGIEVDAPSFRENRGFVDIREEDQEALTQLIN
jgi:hypothetical protein